MSCDERGRQHNYCVFVATSRKEIRSIACEPRVEGPKPPPRRPGNNKFIIMTTAMTILVIRPTHHSISVAACSSFEQFGEANKCELTPCIYTTPQRTYSNGFIGVETVVWLFFPISYLIVTNAPIRSS